jgi:branched-chain amino acid transport system substrate-binding protein
MPKNASIAPPQTAVPQKRHPIVYLVGLSGLFSVGLMLRAIIPVPSTLRISAGEQLLISANASPAKKAGIKARRDRQFVQAEAAFGQSLQQFPNDPEALIYRNNAIAAIKNPGVEPLRIAVSVPISSNLNVAQEILRGVAQAQNQLNQQGGIGGRFLQVLIADDANDPGMTEQIAIALVNDPTVLAVVGHNASNASVVAAPIYQKAGLVMISPTSSTNQLSGFGSAILRTIPPTNFMADIAVEHLVKVEGKTKIAVCIDQAAPDNIAYKDAFLAALVSRGGIYVPIDCNLSAPSFNPVTSLQEATQQGAQGILLAPHIDRLAPALNLAQSNQGRLALYTSSTMYTFQTLEQGKSAIAGLMLPVVWHPEQPEAKTFVAAANILWGGTVNWRTATAYDATQSIITGLDQAKNRADLITTIRDRNFESTGASGVVKFLPSGDRQMTPILVQAKATSKGMEFMPVSAEKAPTAIGVVKDAVQSN